MPDFPRLPEPQQLDRAIIVHYEAGSEKLRLLCSALAIEEVHHPPRFDPPLMCLHMKCGKMPYEGPMVGSMEMLNFVVPVDYVTYVEMGPAIELLKKGEKEKQVIVFPGGISPNAMGLEKLKAKIREIRSLA